MRNKMADNNVSARGKTIDFNLLKMKSDILKRKKSDEVLDREDYVDRKRRRSPSRPLEKEMQVQKMRAKLKDQKGQRKKKLAEEEESSILDSNENDKEPVEKNEEKPAKKSNNRVTKKRTIVKGS